MYTEFLEQLAWLSKQLEPLAQSPESAQSGMPIPYITGRIAVHLDGEVIGYFELQDDYVNYVNEPPPPPLKGGAKHVPDDPDGIVLQ